MDKKRKEMEIYQEYVADYLKLQVSQRSMFSITLEVSNENASLINEAMVSPLSFNQLAAILSEQEP